MKNRQKSLKIILSLMALNLSYGMMTPKTIFAHAQPKAITITAGKKKVLKIHTAKKVRWKTSNKRIVQIRSIGKTKARITGKKSGKATISAKAGKKKWIFKIKVKKKFSFKIRQAPRLIRYYAPDIAANNADVIKSLDITDNQLPSFIHFPTMKRNVTAAAQTDAGDLNMIRMTVSNQSQVSCHSSNNKILNVKKTIPWKYVTDANANHIRLFVGTKTLAYALIPHKRGTATITIRYPSGIYKKKISVEPSAVYLKVKDQIEEINNSGLDDAQKAFLLAGYECQLMKYTGDGNQQWHTLYEDIIDGTGVCEDYA